MVNPVPLAHRVKAEADENWQFGMTVEGQLDEDSQSALYDMVVLRQGTLHSDGWITLPRKSAFPSLIAEAERLGVRLTASVRPR